MNTYKIHKILNNNVVVSIDKNTSREVIIVGSGIGFKKRVGNFVDSKMIFKVYDLRNSKMKNSLESMLQSIPFECIQITEKIIQKAKNELKQEYSSNLLLVLADHINFAVNSYKEKKYRQVILNEEIKRFYKDEYKIGKFGVKLINDHYQIDLPMREAVAIAFHFVNAQYGDNIPNTLNIMNCLSEILKIIEKELQVELDEESREYSRLVIHLRFFLKSVQAKEKDETENLDSMFLNIDEDKHDKVFKTLEEIQNFLKIKYGFDISENEKFYLLIHILRIFQINYKGDLEDGL